MSKIFNRFFEALEDEIESKWDNIRCKDIYNLYLDFWNALKENTGTAHGFTGLSEVIIFTILNKLIEKECGEQLTRNRYTSETYYLSNSKFAIGRGLQVKASGGKRMPDIAIWKSPDKVPKIIPPDFAIEIKVYTAEEALKTVENAISRLKALKDAKDTFKGMLIFYYRPSRLNEVEKRLEKESNWLKWVTLENNNENFVEILRDWLK